MGQAIGKKVKITKYYDRYIGREGIVKDESDSERSHLMVEMPDGNTIYPWRPESNLAQCKWIEENITNTAMERKYNIENLKDKKIALYPQTEQEYKAVLQVMEDAGLKWCSGDKPTDLAAHYWRENGTKKGVGIDAKSRVFMANKHDWADMTIPVDDFLAGNKPTDMDSKQAALSRIEEMQKEIDRLRKELSRPEPTWEPKVGMWVFYGEDGGCAAGAEKIAKRLGEKSWESADGRTMYICPGRDKYRPATPEEIAAAQTKTVHIGTSKLAVTIDSKGIHADGKTVALREVEKLVKWAQEELEDHVNLPWTVSTPTLKVGCCDSVSITELQEIVKAAKELGL